MRPTKTPPPGLVRAGDLATAVPAPAGFARYTGFAPAGDRWVRVNTEDESTLVRAAFGLAWDHDSVLNLMRMTCADGRVLLARDVPLGEFERLVRAVGTRVRQ